MITTHRPPAAPGGGGDDDRRHVTIAEALRQGYPILDPLGSRLHYPGEEQYEAWRDAAQADARAGREN